MTTQPPPDPGDDDTPRLDRLGSVRPAVSPALNGHSSTASAQPPRASSQDAELEAAPGTLAGAASGAAGGAPTEPVAGSGVSARGSRPPWWVAVVAVAVYLVLAAGLANLLTDTIATRTPAADFALGHYPVLIPLIVAAVVLVHRAGWARVVWRTPAPWEEPAVGRRRRWWLLAFPVLLAVQVLLLFTEVPWATRGLVLVVVVLVGTLLVGIGEELYFRGILRAAVRGRHGEVVTLLVTSAVFGVAHSVGSLIGGVPVSFIAFQVGVTAVNGAVLYGVLRAAGRLWVAMLLHGLNDAGLYLTTTDVDTPAATGSTPNGGNAAVQAALWALAAVLLISAIRQDHHARQQRTTQQPLVSVAQPPADPSP